MSIRRDLHWSRSTDGGLTWSTAAPLPPAKELAIHCGALTALADGRILYAWNTWYDAHGVKSRFPQFALTTDEGKTWSAAKSLPKNPRPHSLVRHPIVELGPNEWLFILSDKTIVYDPRTEKWAPLADGRNHSLVPIVRTAKGTLVSGAGLRSSDQGKTWQKFESLPMVADSPPKDRDSNIWRFDLVALSNGWLVATELLGAAPAVERYRFLVGRDDGQSWDFDGAYEFYHPGRPIVGRGLPRTVQLDKDTLGTVFFDLEEKQPGGPGVFFLRTPISKLEAKGNP